MAESVGKLDRLEGLRGFAALYVAAGPILNVHFENPRWALPGRFAAEVVILFFLLSGFVIRYSTRDDTSGSEYFFKRFRRIYPLFFLTLLLSYGLRSWAEHQFLLFDIKQFLANVFMLQDFAYKRPGAWFNTFYNDALWSLSYEWWFYVFFYPLLKWRAATHIKTICVYSAALVCLGLHFVYPTQIGWFGMYFAVWWAGALLADEYRATGNVSLRRHVPSVLVLLLIAAICAIPLTWMAKSDWVLGLWPLVEIRRFAAAALIIVAACLWRGLKWRGFDYTFGLFKVFAPLTYGLYILHFPVLVFVNSQPFARNHALFLVICIPLLLIIAYLGEITLQGAINRWTEPWLQRIKNRHRRATVAPVTPARDR